jgi:hypothetical protein
MQNAGADILFKALQSASLQSGRLVVGDLAHRAPARILETKSLVFGQRCVTKYGTCAIAPQPVGSPCTCGTAEGKTFQ